MSACSNALVAKAVPPATCTVDYFRAPNVPTRIAFDPSGKLWFEGYDTIGYWDTDVNKAFHIRTRAGTLPDGLAFTSKRAWFAEYKGYFNTRSGWQDRIGYVDATNSVHEVNLFSKQWFASPGFLGAVAAEQNSVWVSAVQRHALIRFDVAARRAKTYALGTGYAVAVLPFPDAVWFSDPVQHRVVRMQISNGAKIGFRNSALREPDQIVGSDKTIWVRDGNDSSVWRLDILRGTLTNTGRRADVIATLGRSLLISLNHTVTVINDSGTENSQIELAAEGVITALAGDTNENAWAVLVNPATGKSRFARVQHPRECGLAG